VCCSTPGRYKPKDEFQSFSSKPRCPAVAIANFWSLQQSTGKNVDEETRMAERSIEDAGFETPR
jgi:hypothetical protein